MSDFAWQSATDLAGRIARREVSSRELVELFLRRIQAGNQRLNAVVTLDAERALERADAADRALARGEVVGPLHGVPITLKDTLETAGLRTTAGYPPLTDHVPEKNAVVVERLLSAGPILLGKTNTPLLGGDWQSYNEIFGTTRNPWDPERTPGGSSGGSAAALAAGFSALEIGSDIGGSIRVPAHWCGVYGLKPSHGVIPLRGHIPGPPGTLSESDLAVVGPLARSADDLDLVLDLVAGPLPDRARAWSLKLPPPRRERLRDYRVAAWLDDEAFPVDPSVSKVLGGAVEAIRKAGATVDDQARPELTLREVFDVYTKLLFPVTVAGFPKESFDMLLAVAADPSTTDDDSLVWLARTGTERHRAWLSANERRERLRARFEAFFERFDVLVMPVNQVPAIPHDHSDPQTARTIVVGGKKRPYFNLLGWAGPATCLLHPAAVAPVGQTDGGLPVGLQIVAPYLEDRTAVDFARRLADVVGGFMPPPGEAA